MEIHYEGTFRQGCNRPPALTISTNLQSHTLISTSQHASPTGKCVKKPSQQHLARPKCFGHFVIFVLLALCLINHRDALWQTNDTAVYAYKHFTCLIFLRLHGKLLSVHSQFLTIKCSEILKVRLSLLYINHNDNQNLEMIHEEKKDDCTGTKWSNKQGRMSRVFWT